MFYKHNKYTFTWQDTHVTHQSKLNGLFNEILGLTQWSENNIQFYNFEDNKYILQDIVMRKQLKIKSYIDSKLDRNKRLHFELDGKPLSNFKITFTQYGELDKEYFIESTDEKSCYKLEFDGEVDVDEDEDEEPLWNLFDDNEYVPLAVKNGGKRKTRRNRKSKKGKKSRKARKSRRKSNRRRGRR